MQHSLTEGQKAVLEAFYEYGKPANDATIAAFVHHMSQRNMSSSGIRTRRAELERMSPPLISPAGDMKLRNGRRAMIHALTSDGVKVVKDG